jgi:hypothetical protein
MKAVWIIFVIPIVLGQYTLDPSNWRPSFDGTGNNVANPLWGSANRRLQRLGPAHYGDGISSDRLAVGGGPLPSPRVISNTVHAAPSYGQPKNFRGLTDFTTYWGQFIAHDMDLTGGPAGSAIPLEPINIPVPKGDPFFDPMSTGTQDIVIDRSIFDPTTGNSSSNPRQQLTLVSSFLDGSHVYGTDNATVTYLRTFSGGLMKTTIVNGLELPPLDTPLLPVENNAHIYNNSQLFLLGDVRGNENPALTVLHTIFLREHNRRARELASNNPTWTDEELYQEARRWVIALIQHVTFDEYMPVTIGDAAPDYTGYNASIDPTIYTEFSTGVFRYGHSEVDDYVYRVDANNNTIPEGHLTLKESYYASPYTIMQVGIEPIIRGMAYFRQNAVDIYFVDALRNYLFGSPGTGGLDLASVNIERGREHGLPSFNDLRRLYGLDPFVNWADINPDPAVYTKLAAAYANIEDCDIYTCGLAEIHDQGLLANLGNTFTTMVIDQYSRVRDGDRFWYENGQWDETDFQAIKSSTLRDIILRNVPMNDTELQCFVFAMPDGCGKPIPPPPAGPLFDSYDWVVRLKKKTPASPYYGKGHAYGFTINDVEQPTLNLTRGQVYKIKVESSCAHAFVFLLTPDENGTVLGPLVGLNGVPLNPNDLDDVNYFGAFQNHGCIDYNQEMTLAIVETAPPYFYYQCDFHNMLMGGNVLINGPTSGAASFVPSALLIALFAVIAALFL